MKLDQLKFGVAGAIVTGIFVFLAELFLWIKYVPLYNSIMVNLYGVAGFSTFGLLKILLVSIVLGLVIGFLFTLLFAWLYNKLLMIKLK
jgi:hypothetical protein|tara:strand:- start:263 stop:529 length:267 start_codon:yes stop_codon:yes gene_type:complete